MKTMKIASAVVLASMVASSALAASGDFYGRVDAGYAIAQKEKVVVTAGTYTAKNKGFAGNLGLGYYYTDAVRMDVNFGYAPGTSQKAKLNNAATNVKVKSTGYTGMVNAYYDFTGMDVVPYVTVGGGVVYEKVKTTNLTGVKGAHKAAFAYQVGLGAAYEVTSGVFLDAGYRFTGNGMKKFTSKDKAVTYKPSKQSSTFLIGARVNF